MISTHEILWDLILKQRGDNRMQKIKGDVDRVFYSEAGRRGNFPHGERGKKQSGF